MHRARQKTAVPPDPGVGVGRDSQSSLLQTPRGSCPGPALCLDSWWHGLENQVHPALLTCNYIYLNLLACPGCTWSQMCLNKRWAGEAQCLYSLLSCPMALFSVGHQMVRLVIWRGSTGAGLFCFDQNMFQSENLLTV